MNLTHESNPSLRFQNVNPVFQQVPNWIHLQLGAAQKPLEHLVERFNPSVVFQHGYCLLFLFRWCWCGVGSAQNQAARRNSIGDWSYLISNYFLECFFLFVYGGPTFWNASFGRSLKRQFLPDRLGQSCKIARDGWFGDETTWQL